MYVHCLYTTDRVREDKILINLIGFGWGRLMNNLLPWQVKMMIHVLYENEKISYVVSNFFLFFLFDPSGLGVFSLLPKKESAVDLASLDNYFF